MNKLIENPAHSPEHLLEANSVTDTNAWEAPKGPSASVDYLIANHIDRNPVMMSEIYPDRVIPGGLKTPKIEDKAPVSYVLDNNLMYNPVFESKIKTTKTIPAAPKSKTNTLNDISIGQAIQLEDSWVEETDQVFPAYSHSREKLKQDRWEKIRNDRKDKLTHIDELPPIIVADDAEADLPPIIVADDAENETLAPVEVPKEKKKLSRRQKIAAVGALVIASLIGVGGIIASQSNDNNGDSAPVVDSGIDIVGAAANVGGTITPPNTESPSTTDTGQISSTNSSQEMLKTLDPSEIQVTGDVMPSTNVSNAGAENHNEAIQAGLDIYNQVTGRNFVLGMGDMFWEGNDHIISRDELADHNLVVKLAAEGLTIEEIQAQLSLS